MPRWDFCAVCYDATFAREKYKNAPPATKPTMASQIKASRIGVTRRGGAFVSWDRSAIATSGGSAKLFILGPFYLKLSLRSFP